jgi:hypothetical protein
VSEGAESNPAGPEAPIPPAGEWGFTGELAPSNLRQLAPVGLELWRRGSEWVNRRVETIELLDVDTVRLRLSIDFRIPSELPGGVPLGGATTYFLPLTVLPRRTTLAYFDLRDESGTALPMLTRQENSRLTGAILYTAAARALAASGEELELSSALITYLATIPTKTRREGRVFVRSVLEPTNDLLYPEPRVAEVLLGDREFRDLLGLCASCSFVHVPLTARAGERRIVKVSLLSPWDSGVGGSRSGESDSRTRRARRRVATWLGWRPETRYLIMPHVGNAESFHVQISAPSRVEFTEAGMRNGPPADLVKADAGSAPVLPGPPGEELNDASGYQQFVGGIGRRKHLYVEGAHAHRTGIIWVRFRVVRAGFLRGALAVGWLVCALLALYAARADNVVGESQTAAALLLLVPALIAGFLIAPGEHAMTRHLLRGPRLLTAATGLLALAATAAMLVASKAGPHPAPGKLVCLWRVEAIIAGVLAVLLTIGAFLPRAGKRANSSPPADHQEPFIGPRTAEQDGAEGNL